MKNPTCHRKTTREVILECKNPKTDSHIQRIIIRRRVFAVFMTIAEVKNALSFFE